MNPSVIMRPIRRWTSALLALLLIVPLFAAPAHAEETVTSIQFESTPSPFKIYVDDETYPLKVWANVTGGSVSQRDVTAEATWSTSNSAVARVDKGIISGIAAGYADITAKYRTASPVTVRVYVEYWFSSVELRRGGAAVGDTLDVELGQSPEFELFGLKPGHSDDNVTDDAVWTSSNTSVATVSDGEVTLVGTGTARITGKSKGRSDSVTLNVTSPYKSITIAPASMLEFAVGDGPETLTATAVQKNDGTLDVTSTATWRSSNTAVATVDKGVVTPVGQGTATITVSHLGVTKSTTVVVRQAYEAMKISDSKLSFFLVDPARKVTVSVLDNSVWKPVTDDAEWTSSNVVAATVDKGLIVPKAVGSAVITAAYKGRSKTVSVTVYPAIESLSLPSKELSGFVGGTGELPAVSAKAVTEETIDVSDLAVWSSSDTDIVTVEDGKWTAKKTGKATLTAAVKSAAATVEITISEKPLALLVPEQDLSLVLGKETPLPKVSVIFENGTEKEDLGDALTWKTSSPNLLIKDGKMRGLLVSKVTLTASYLGATIPIRVTIEEEITKLTVEPPYLVLNPGKSKSVKVTGTYKSGKTVVLSTKMNWQVSSDTLAVVKGSSVKALAEGTGKLTGSYQGKPVEVNLIVKPLLKKLVLSATSLKLGIGASSEVELTALYDGGKQVDAAAAAAWTTSNAKVATVAGGKITAVGKGTATIKAAYEGKTVSVRVAVK